LRWLLDKNGIQTLLTFHHLTWRFEVDLALQQLFLVVARTHNVLLRQVMLVILGHLSRDLVVEIDVEDFFIHFGCVFLLEQHLGMTLDLLIAHD